MGKKLIVDGVVLASGSKLESDQALTLATDIEAILHHYLQVVNADLR